MDKLPCSICENGDVYSNVICDDCEERIDDLREMHEAMIRFVYRRHDFVGYIPRELSNFIEESVSPLYNALQDIEIPEDLKEKWIQRNLK